MFSVLKVPHEKVRDKLISDVKSRVTSISSELGRDITAGELMNNIIWGFKNFFRIEFEPSVLSQEESVLSKRLENDIFKNEQWLYER